MFAARCLTHPGGDMPVIHDWHVRAAGQRWPRTRWGQPTEQNRPFGACKALTAGHEEAQVFGDPVVSLSRLSVTFCLAQLLNSSRALTRSGHLCCGWMATITIVNRRAP